MTDDDRRSLHDQLVALRDQLEAGASDDKQAVQPVTLDQQSVGRLSRMDAMQVQAMAKDTQRRREIQRVRVDAALARIEDDSYGLCAQCEEPIAIARLRIDPAAPLCIECAEAGQS